MFHLTKSYSVRLKHVELPGVSLVGINKSDIITGFALIVAILGTNYAMSGFPNVKLFDLLVFSAGYVLGFRKGVFVAASAWLFYGTFNPWGMADSLLLTVLMTSETIYAFLGFGFRQLISPQSLKVFESRQIVILVGLAILGTLLYDLVTNIYTGIVWAHFSGGSYLTWVNVALFNPGALLFSLVHVSSNIILFSMLGPLFIKGFMLLNIIAKDRTQ